MSKLIFTKIYKENLWGNRESRSGHGSSLEYTSHLREDLKNLFQELKIQNLFDAPCGDFNWMKEIIKDCNIDYVGGDIVEELINSNNFYSNDKTKFYCIDITSQSFPDAKLWLCRDCFIHLSYNDILLSLKNFLNSNISYILTTTHINVKNSNIETGGFRHIDLFEHPFNFPKNPIFRISDYNPPFHLAELILWHRDQISEIIDLFERNISSS